MSYVRPDDVHSPKGHWRLKQVLHDGGELEPTQTDASNWSAAEGQWKGDEGWYDCLALRWNGGTGGEIGNPQSRGYATWFIVPPKLEEAIRRMISPKRPQSRKDVPWSKRQEIPDPQILDAAQQYENACKLLDEQPPSRGVLLPLMNTAAVAVELYLKCLSAELIYVEDDLMPKSSRVYAAPEIGHGLVALLNAMHQDTRDSLNNAFNAEIKARWNKDLRSVLKGLEGAFSATRYPFEYGTSIRRYNLTELIELTDFLGRFARRLPTKNDIEWK